MSIPHDAFAEVESTLTAGRRSLCPDTQTGKVSCSSGWDLLRLSWAPLFWFSGLCPLFSVVYLCAVVSPMPTYYNDLSRSGAFSLLNAFSLSKPRTCSNHQLQPPRSIFHRVTRLFELKGYPRQITYVRIAVESMLILIVINNMRSKSHHPS